MAALWRERQGLAAGEPPTLGVLGAGSDWTAFFHWAGVPSLQWTSNGRGTYWPVYHSVLDDFEYAERFADPGFEGAAAMARVMGLTALRLADADALPLLPLRGRCGTAPRRPAGHPPAPGGHRAGDGAGAPP